MILAITADERFGSEGHHCGEHQARDLVEALGAWLTQAPEQLHIPDGLVSWLRGSVLGEIVAGYGRPLGYLCSDCRYPKWNMTSEEVLATYGHVAVYAEKAQHPEPSGFCDVTNACPKCGD